MSNTIGRFDFEVIAPGENDPYPFDPAIKLCVKNYGDSTRDGLPTMSANLMSEREIDDRIRDLKEDLEVLGKKAKRALASAREQTMSQLKGRNR